MFANASVDLISSFGCTIWSAFSAVSGIWGCDPRTDGLPAYLSESQLTGMNEQFYIIPHRMGQIGNPIPSGALHPSCSVPSARSYPPNPSPSETTCQYPIPWHPRNTSILLKSLVPLLHNLQSSIHCLDGLTKNNPYWWLWGTPIASALFSSFPVYSTPLHHQKGTKLSSNPSVPERVQTH